MQRTIQERLLYAKSAYIAKERAEVFRVDDASLVASREEPFQDRWRKDLEMCQENTGLLLTLARVQVLGLETQDGKLVRAGNLLPSFQIDASKGKTLTQNQIPCPVCGALVKVGPEWTQGNPNGIGISGWGRHLVPARDRKNPNQRCSSGVVHKLKELMAACESNDPLPGLQRLQAQHKPRNSGKLENYFSSIAVDSESPSEDDPVREAGEDSEPSSEDDHPVREAEEDSEHPAPAGDVVARINEDAVRMLADLRHDEELPSLYLELTDFPN
jgi:hypothetical protein